MKFSILFATKMCKNPINSYFMSAIILSNKLYKYFFIVSLYFFILFIALALPSGIGILYQYKFKNYN